MTAMFRITRAQAGEHVDVLTVQGRGPGDIPDDAIEVVESTGLRVRPAVRPTTEALVVELQTGDRLAFVVDKSRRAGAVALDEGETQLRGDASPATVIRLLPSGDIEITPAPGRAVTIAGGTHHAAREGHAVSAGTSMAAWITAVTSAINALVGPGTATAPTDFGSIGEGTDRVRLP